MCYENIDWWREREKSERKSISYGCVSITMHPIYREIQEYGNRLMGQMFGPMTNGHPL
jgi:hypothetical protein